MTAPALTPTAPAPRPSARAQFLDHRTYRRPVDPDDPDSRLESHGEARGRVRSHLRTLYVRAVENALDAAPGDPDPDALARKRGEIEEELDELFDYINRGWVSMSGRVKWMGGTEVIARRAAAAFNCAFGRVGLPADVVDAFWLLLQGCGVGFEPVTGMLTGFARPLTVETVGSTRTGKGGAEETAETFDPATGEWVVKFGDSAAAWARGVGKLLTSKYPATRLVLDFTELRPAGQRLKGYGWISSGWEPFARSLTQMCEVLNAHAGNGHPPRPLDQVAIVDVLNLLGAVLSSRRSAQIALVNADDPRSWDFAVMKNGYWKKDPAGGAPDGRWWRDQSNNSLAFDRPATRMELEAIFGSILNCGEPGFYNRQAARLRAAWAVGGNPCMEILLPDGGFCNLIQTVPHRIPDDLIERVFYIAARANYRQTCVSMRDGVLQLKWNDNNRLLRLCGVAPIGFVAWRHAEDPAWWGRLRRAARQGADGMAEELCTPKAALVTQVQPGGTSSKVLGREGDEVHEGGHVAISRWLFNNVAFDVNDPLLNDLRGAGYRVRPKPLGEGKFSETSYLVTFPVEYADRPGLFREETRTRQVPNPDRTTLDRLLRRRATVARTETLALNRESAVRQLERYKLMMRSYVDHNMSVTVSFDPEEVPAIIDWLMENWDDFVGVSFMRRTDPALTAEEMGHPYLPQQPVSREEFERYAAGIRPVDLERDRQFDGVDEMGCGPDGRGACPVR